MARLIDYKALRIFNALMDETEKAWKDFKEYYDRFMWDEINENKLNRVGQKATEKIGRYTRTARLISTQYDNIKYMPGNDVVGRLNKADDAFCYLVDFLNGCKVL